MNVEIDCDTVLGHGRQGRIHPVTKIDGIRRNDLIVKLYFNHTLANRLKIFVDYINEKNLLAEPILECLPAEFLGNGKNIGVIMKKARGVSLENSYKELSGDPLSLRLKYCYDISKGVRVLHESGMIHSDISDVNVIKNRDRIWIIDIDGGGIIPRNMMPSIRGHTGGSWIAPEVFLDQNRLPDIHSDEWSLAVLIHNVLIPGIDPLYFLEKYIDIKKLAEWPPQTVKKDYREVQKIQISCLKACDPIFDLLKTTFNQGLWSPDRRVSAGKLEETLAFCLQSIVKCTYCQEDIIAVSRNKCPFCGNILTKVTLKIKDKEYSLDSHRLYLTAEDFGLHEDKSLAIFELTHDKVLCRLLSNIKIRYCGKETNHNEILQIATDRLRLLEISYNGLKLPAIIQGKNMFQKSEVIKITHNDNNDNNSQRINQGNLSHGRIARIKKKKGFWRKLFGS